MPLVIKKAGKPNYLNEKDFIKWEANFTQVDQSNISKLVLGDVDVEFSDELIQNQYTAPTLDAVIDIIYSTFEIGKETDKELRTIKKYFPKYGIEGLNLRKLAGYIAEDNHLSCEEILSILRGMFNGIASCSGNYIFSTYLLGCYWPQGKVITLYTKAIEQVYANNLKEGFESVFIHEYFHAFHYDYASRHRLLRNGNTNTIEIFARNDYLSKVVKESMATYYTNQYIDKFFLKIDKYYSNIPLAFDPYAGAKYFNDFYNFNVIFDCSIFNMDEALRMMVFDTNVCEYYLVVNKKRVIRKVTRIQHKPSGTMTPCLQKRPGIFIVLTPDEQDLRHMGKGWFICKAYQDFVDANDDHWSNYAIGALRAKMSIYNKNWKGNIPKISNTIRSILTNHSGNVSCKGLDPSKLLFESQLMDMAQEILKVI